MPLIKRHGIQQQVAMLTLIPLLILTVCLEFFLLQGRFSDLDQGLLERGKLISRQLASSSEYGVFSNNQAFLKTIAHAVLHENDVRGLLILNADGQELLSEYQRQSKSDHVGVAAIATALAGEETGASTIELTAAQLATRVTAQMPISFDEHSIWIYQAIVPAQVSVDDLDAVSTSQQIGAVIIEMSKLHTERHKRKMLLITLLGTFIFLLISLYLVYLASRTITLPTRQLSVAVKQIAQGDLGTRVRFDTKIEELSTLAHGLNDMAVQLEQDREILQQRIEQATSALREKKDEAERANLNKSQFLATASHDLRQPLHALGLYVSELRRQLSSTPQQHLVERVEQSVDALATLLNALLDISKLDAGAITPQMQPCDIAAMLGRVANDYQMLASISNIRLVVHPLDGYVMSDPMLLERVVTNLVSNAIRYSHANGCVLIACRRRGNQMRVEIRDNGIGISESDQSKIFREFFQITKPQLDSDKGQGLGLAIVDRLVKLLGIGIELRSAPDKGTLFALQIALGSAPEIIDHSDKHVVFVASEQNSDALPLSGKRVLVVDDDQLVLTSTSTILTAWGGQVSLAGGLQSVQEMLSEGKDWDLIISDYQLGVAETGLDVIRAVREQRSKGIPAILISGDTSPELLQLANSAGHHLIHKPVKPAKLRSLLMFLLQESASTRS
ncbi:MAG: ATP-binding protein [Gallionella sp.]|nr:ATP-binding protein [Gallionella sp.]